MNRNTEASFKRITNAAEGYKKSVTSALWRYRQAAQEARQFKDEVGRLAAAQANARNAIASAEATFTGNVTAEIDILKGELANHLVTPPTGNFLAALSTYQTFGLVPSKMEINALLMQAAGNALSLRALSALLEKNGSKYRIEAPAASDFESDIESLESLAQGNIRWAPNGYHSELTAVYGNSTRLVSNGKGGLYDGGYKWDSTALVIATGSFDATISSIDGMAQRWTSNILPVIFDSGKYKGHTDQKTGEKVSPEQEYIADREATASAAEITESPDAYAMEIAKRTAAENARAKEVLGMYK